MVDTLQVTVDLKLNLNTKGNFFKLAGEKKIIRVAMNFTNSVFTEQRREA